MDSPSKQVSIQYTMGLSSLHPRKRIPTEHRIATVLGTEFPPVDNKIVSVQGTKLWLITQLALDPSDDLSMVLSGYWFHSFE